MNADVKDLITLRAGHALPVEHIKHPRARKLMLKLDPIREVAVITTPRRVGKKEALSFAQNNMMFLEHRLKELPPWQSFEPGASFMIGDQSLTITHRPDARRGVWQDSEHIYVSGDADFVPRRVTDWLKQEARRRFSEPLYRFAEMIDAPRPKLRIGDPMSRWGSCSHTGTVALSWRLIAAPEKVQTYVIGHEAAHLRHPDHSRAFWALVTELVGPHKAEQDWLKRNGLTLHRMGQRP